MVAYPEQAEAVQKKPSVSILRETQGEALDIVKFLQEERVKDLEIREKVLTTELNEVRRQLGKTVQKFRKRCQSCGVLVEWKATPGMEND